MAANGYTATVSGKITYDTHADNSGTIVQYKILANDSTDRSKLTVAISDGRNTIEDAAGTVNADTTIAGTSGTAQVITTTHWNVTVQTDSKGDLSATLNIDMHSSPEHKWSQDITTSLAFGHTYPISGEAAEGGC